MTKVKLVDPLEQEQQIPPMPGAEPIGQPGADGQSSPSTGSEGTLEAVSEDLAGDLIALPFAAWNLFQPEAQPLTEFEKARLAGPFARILEKYGLGKIAKDEIVFGFYLTAIVYGRVKAVRDSHKVEAAIDKGQATSDQRI